MVFGAAVFCIYIFETQNLKNPCLCREVFDPTPGLTDYLEDIDHREEMIQSVPVDPFPISKIPTSLCYSSSRILSS